MGRGTRYAGTMKYAILRVQKLKSAVAVHRSMKHSFRAQDTPNADPGRTPNNTHIGAGSVAEGMAAFRAALPDKVRSNAVQCVEFLVAASPEAMQGKTRAQQDAYLLDALGWIRERHGAENVICAGIHRDEKTPHMYAYVVPKDPDTGRLNCRRFLGGAEALREMQTDFARQIGRPHGLERGIQGSKATHQRVKRYYGMLHESVPGGVRINPEMIEPQTLQKAGFFDKLRGRGDLIEGPEMIADRINETLMEQVRPIIDGALVAHQTARQLKQEQASNRALRGRLEPYEELMGPLSKPMQEQAKEIIAAVGQKLREDQRQAEAAAKAIKIQKRQLRTLSGKPVRGRDMGR